MLDPSKAQQNKLQEEKKKEAADIGRAYKDTLKRTSRGTACSEIRPI
jgi:hypothetical protein